MNSTKRSPTKALMSVLLATIMLFGTLLPIVQAVTYSDGYGSHISGNGGDVSGDYNIIATNDSAIVGYRFSLLSGNTDGSFDNKGSIDVFHEFIPGYYPYHLKFSLGSTTGYNVDKYTLKYWYQHFSSQLSFVKEEKSLANKVTTGRIDTSKYNYAIATDLGIALPYSPTIANSWVLVNTNIDKILDKIKAGTKLSTLSVNQYVFMEPLFAVRINSKTDGEGTCLTTSEYALLGIALLGKDSTGGTSGWSTIRAYTNRSFASAVITNDYPQQHEDLRIENGSKIASGNYETFENILVKGYGLCIAWNTSQKQKEYNITYNLNIYTSKKTFRG